MTEARKVLKKRKEEIEQTINALRGRENKQVKDLGETRTMLILKKRLLKEIMDVYDTLKKEID